MTKPLVGHQLDDQQGKRGRRRRVPVVVDRTSVGRVLPRAGRSGLAAAPGSVVCRARSGATSRISSRQICGEPFLVVLIIFAVTRHIWSTRRCPRRCYGGSKGSPVRSRMGRGRGCRSVDRGRKVDTEAEVGDKAVTQVLGREII
jgi:hypothetical protein